MSQTDIHRVREAAFKQQDLPAHKKNCESYQNLKTTKVIDLIGLFDADFETELRRQWSEELELERQHIDNMLDDRITIAHRKRLHVNVSSSKLEDYFKTYSSFLNRVYVHFLDA